ncbi:DUF2786 domain-containing protein [Micromonospora sp. DT227]|uniref:DUF2786 domain-containing protein n=1 Tax=Micromonospora sp. DT227 TaxID=3393433 RepID=UPI003CE6FF68
MQDLLDLDALEAEFEAALAAADVDLDKMLDRIRKMLAKAEDPAATSAEATAFTAKAIDLMGKYGVSAAMLEAADPTANQVENRYLEVPGPYAYDKVLLLITITDALGVKHIRLTTGTNQRMRLFGMNSDLDRVNMLFTSLLVQSASELGKTPCPPHIAKIAFVKNFMTGYRASIGKRLKAAETNAQDEAETQRRQHGGEGPSVALVLRDRAALVKDAFEAEYPKVRTQRGRERSGAGIGAGLAAGNRANLGGTSVGAGREAIGAGR